MAKAIATFILFAIGWTFTSAVMMVLGRITQSLI